jgi:hypothetical protein
MRIRITKKLTPSNIDARSDRFQPGFQYEVDSTLGWLFLAEGWAKPVVSEEPVLVRNPQERQLPTLPDAIAADIAFDDAIAAAIERRAASVRASVFIPFEKPK